MESTTYHRVLFIAPSDSGLDVTPEIDSLSELGYLARSLQGKVSGQRIFNATRRAQWDVLHFACHANGVALILSDNEQFGIDSILQVARMCGAKLIFLNACNTAQLGQTLVDEHVPAVITTLVSIEDGLAKQTAQTFYQCLSRSVSAHDAFRSAKPASRGIYQFLSNGSYQEILMEPVMKQLSALSELTGTNNAEHDEIRSNIAALTVSCGEAKEQKRWFLRYMISSIFMASIITFVLTLVFR